ncbi:MAG: hypothetical protein ACYC5K_00185, partial [Saccharofermentanales bacterium]
GSSIMTYKMVTNAPYIDNLNGESYQFGGSVGIPIEGIPLAAGAELNVIPDPKNNTNYFGITRSVGFGTPGGEVHGEWGYTVTGFQVNIFDIAQYIYQGIMEW